MSKKPVQIVEVWHGPKHNRRKVRLGCPPGGCVRHCGGGWGGTKMTGEAMKIAATKGRLNPNKLGCATTMFHGELAYKKFTPLHLKVWIWFSRKLLPAVFWWIPGNKLKKW
ncbi:MAG: hypothetical protein UU77_C0009G0002 [candidate division WWE3 bacterium GW2011_GWC1_41_7]|uniref:Uncharacterized protein n=2 Tax=Katanobacteria TaxID=422282 RepID=A0A0G0X7X6_UNCKA|nr:MAG: hypothetical protein UU72_C0004G0005 [candidate division WWE3 bacterium GW2011_GWB1_41_6]KKS21040.1 MAG: hypothetical protein UU77_C0009G0002 [candidate division WWE3 bacterium GW2011_GWC1_41_7]